VILAVIYTVALFPIFHPSILQRRFGVYYILGFTPEVLRLHYKLGLEKVTHACCRAINAGGCSAKLVEQYLYPSIPIEDEEYKFIELKTQPDDDCSIYSKLYLKS